MDLADLIDRNAAFTPDKPALRYRGQAWSYADLAVRITALARAMKSQLGVHRGDRVAVLALNSPDYLALLYACARLGAMLVPLNWRLAVPEQVFILRDAAVKALFVEHAFDAVCAPLADVLPETRIVGLDCSPEPGSDLATLIDAGSGDGREPYVDWRAPLLIVYTAGTTGRPKGAVLTQEALLWNGVMSQHMHAMTADDHVLTVLPLFHVGGMNIQTTPALHLGATVTIHPRFTADDTLRAIAQERPSLAVLVPATIQALLEHPRWHDTHLSSLRAAFRFCRFTARPKPARSRCTRVSAAICRAAVRQACQASSARRAWWTRTDRTCCPTCRAKWLCVARTSSPNTGGTRRRQQRLCAKAGSGPATSRCATPMGILPFRTARRT
jgi:fatty-acyl-CoA synthase